MFRHILESILIEVFFAYIYEGGNADVPGEGTSVLSHCNIILYSLFISVTLYLERFINNIHRIRPWDTQELYLNNFSLNVAI